MDEQTATQTETSEKERESLRILPVVLGVSILLATLFTAWTPSGLFSGNISDKLSLLLTSEPEEIVAVSTAYPQLRVGIVSGHWGYDAGAVCYDGNGDVTLTEADVNLKIATLVQQKLTQAGYRVDLLQEFDSRLDGYTAVALVSIHNDSCAFIDDNATGFKIAAAMDTRDVNRASRLTSCMRDRYERTTKLNFHPGSITSDMREYHAFAEIHDTTIAAIIETGFLNLDREILTQHPELIAEGIVQGIECFINNEGVEATPVPNFSE